MRGRLAVTLVLGTVIYGVLPVYAPPVVLQSEEVRGFLLGLGISAVAGAILALVCGGALLPGMAVVVASVFAGTVLYVLLNAFSASGLSEEPLVVWPALVAITLVYLGIPAAVGAAMAGTIVALASRLRRRPER